MEDGSVWFGVLLMTFGREFRIGAKLMKIRGSCLSGGGGGHLRLSVFRGFFKSRVGA